MKKLLFLVLLSMSSTLSAQDSFHPEAFTQKVFDLIKANHVEELAEHLIAQEDIESLLAKLEDDNHQAAYIKRQLKEDADQDQQSAVEKLKTTVDKLHEVMEEKGVNRKFSKFSHATYGITGSSEVFIAHFTVYFKDANDSYSISIENCVYIDNEWKLGKITRFNNKPLLYKKCGYCGSKNHRSDSKCSNCGAPLD